MEKRERKGQKWWKRETETNLDACIDNSVIFQITHRNETMDLRHAQPPQGVWHKSLETRIGDAGNVLGAVEILRSLVTTFRSFPHVVHEVFSDLFCFEGMRGRGRC